MASTATQAIRKIGRFLIREEIARGGFARVLRARDIDLCRDVAIKVFSPHPDHTAARTGKSPPWRDVFLAEARLLESVDDPGVVRLLEFGMDATTDAPFYVMPLCDGDLRRRIGGDDGEATGKDEPRALPPGTVKDLLAGVLGGLAALHGRGVVHRDVTPGNILLRGHGPAAAPILADMGIAALAGSGGTIDDSWVGSWDYAAPEHKDGDVALDARADLYSVGVLAYRLLTGRLPEGAARPPKELMPGLSPAFDAWILRALATDKRLRHASAVEMRDALRAVPVDGWSAS